MMICLAASIAALWGVLKYFEAWRERMKGDHHAARDAVAGWWLLGVVLIGVAWLQFGVSHMSGAQARYLHPALLPASIGLSWGWIKIWKRGAVLTVASLLFGAVLLAINGCNIFIWKTLV